MSTTNFSDLYNHGFGYGGICIFEKNQSIQRTSDIVQSIFLSRGTDKPEVISFDMTSADQIQNIQRYRYELQQLFNQKPLLFVDTSAPLPAHAEITTINYLHSRELLRTMRSGIYEYSDRWRNKRTDKTPDCLILISANATPRYSEELGRVWTARNEGFDTLERLYDKTSEKVGIDMLMVNHAETFANIE